MTEKSTIAGLISKAAKKLRDDFEHIRETISHFGEKGGETEDKVRESLNGHLPKRFHATKGFVIDTENQMSDHQDVIIYDQQSSPVYKYDGANQIVSADAVAAIIEVKAVLNKSQLEEAFAKIEEVKRLKKRPISDMDQKATESTLTTTGTLGIILGFGSDLSLQKLAEHCVELNEKYETAHRPDIIVVLDGEVINYTVQFIGARSLGDLAVASDDEFVIPSCYFTSSRGQMVHSRSTGFSRICFRTSHCIRGDPAFRRFRCSSKERHQWSTVQRFTSSTPKDDWFGSKFHRPRLQSAIRLLG
jgi:hypothetical protein